MNILGNNPASNFLHEKGKALVAKKELNAILTTQNPHEERWWTIPIYEMRRSLGWVIAIWFGTHQWKAWRGKPTRDTSGPKRSRHLP